MRRLSVVAVGVLTLIVTAVPATAQDPPVHTVSGSIVFTNLDCISPPFPGAGLYELTLVASDGPDAGVATLVGSGGGLTCLAPTYTHAFRFHTTEIDLDERVAVLHGSPFSLMIRERHLLDAVPYYEVFQLLPSGEWRDIMYPYGGGGGSGAVVWS